MDFKINEQITSKNCKYRVDQVFAHSCYLGTAILTGELGDIESPDRILIVADQGLAKIANIALDKKCIIETLSLYGEKIVIVSDSNDIRKEIMTYFQKHTVNPVVSSANRYQGETLNGRPHGFGTLRYGDGKVYTGHFVNGLRHGHGKLIVPDGQYFEGMFYNDSITEEGIYYDEKGNPRNVHKYDKAKSFGNLIWDKTWRLWASLACFLLAALSVWLIIDFFSSGRGGIVRISIFVAPFVLVGYGIINLIGFFTHLTGTKTE